jgi:hypothetical protein
LPKIRRENSRLISNPAGLLFFFGFVAVFAGALAFTIARRFVIVAASSFFCFAFAAGFAFAFRFLGSSLTFAAARAFARAFFVLCSKHRACHHHTGSKKAGKGGTREGFLRRHGEISKKALLS